LLPRHFIAQAGIDYRSSAATDNHGDIGKAHDGPGMVFAVFSLTRGWGICANTPITVRAASATSFECDFMMYSLYYADSGTGAKGLERQKISLSAN
jgi:hypothetical protein